MASLNLSTNGPSIKSSYQGVVNSLPLSSSSPTFAQWAVFSVQAPLLNAFQDVGAKESVLKVETKGDGELSELIEEFNEGRIQYAFVKVKDPNTALPKFVMIAWCGGGVPERTKGYFTSHTAAVAKVLHGYHVQITARSDSDLAPEIIVQKVADASGSKYSVSSSGGLPAPAPPPVASKPVFTTTTSSSGGTFNPLASRSKPRVDEDGWGADAPPVTRTQIEKVESAYKPTKVNMAELTGQKQEPSRFGAPKPDDDRSGIIGGSYQPVGKVDIAALRSKASQPQDDRPTLIKGAYEPVGKVDIAAIRAKAHRPADEDAPPRALPGMATSSAPAQSERLTTLPKPKIGSKFGAAAAFAGTKAPTPGGAGFSGAATTPTPQVGSAGRSFADLAGKTPAQIWAEKKAKERGVAPALSASSAVSPPLTSPVAPQKSGDGWKSGYTGKSWAAVQTPAYGRTAIDDQKTGESESARSATEQPASPASGGGVSAMRDRFKDSVPISAGAPPPPVSLPRAMPDYDEPAPPPLPSTTSRPQGGYALPAMPVRPTTPPEEEDDAPPLPPPPPAMSNLGRYESDEEEPEPIRLAVPVGRGREPEPEPGPPIQRSLPPAPAPAPVPTPAPAPAAAGKRALVQYDYEKAEDNEIELVEGQIVTDIEMVDEDWWMGTNSNGETGLFPSNYVELVDEGGAAPAHAAAAVPPPPPAAEPEPQKPAEGGAGPTATALFDYEAAEDNELAFDEGATITGLEFPDEDWWFGHFKGKSGLFPANYVQLDA